MGDKLICDRCGGTLGPGPVVVMPDDAVVVHDVCGAAVEPGADSVIFPLSLLDEGS